MHRTVIPVVLQFSNVAANSSLNFTFTTPGVKWSLGRRMGDSLGFSYNVLPDGVYGSTPTLQSVSFNDDVLALRTSSIAPSLSDFTLTLFLDVAPDTTFLQGYCTLNNEAVIEAYLGNERPVQWRNGRISAVIQAPISDYRSVLFTISGLKPNKQVDIGVATDPRQGKVVWALGPRSGESLGVSLSSTNGGSIPLSLLSYTNNQILMQTGAAEGSSATDVVMLAYVSWQPEDLPFIYLKVAGDPDISVYAQVGTRQPQWVSPAYTLFTL
ncbi:hypothetical protein [Dyella tabacisoli]|uniref:Uncharacterized protein n=1 Tax=Dyella tabacisoli TaxID=2282381 RepID=A0A369USM7_9GAMM|nr:hypothetical protein [Dyella tabacisoli]RDD81339.1 hypothetical protein DVJ77_13710 [Dyella tabacisoli]